MAVFPNVEEQGLIIGLNSAFDFNADNIKSLNDEQFRIFVTQLHNRINQMALAVNLKDTGIYTQQEIINGQTFSDITQPLITDNNQSKERPDFRKVFFYNTALPNTGTATIAHGIPFNSSYTMTRLYGASSDTTGLNYIGFGSSFIKANGTDILEVNVDATFINIITSSAAFIAFNRTVIVLEYLKN